MITIEQSESFVSIAVLGEFTLADFKSFEEHVAYKLQSPGQINLLFDLRAMLDYTLDVAWEEIKFFNKQHRYDFSKIAVVTTDQWLMWQAGLSRLFVDAEIEVFSEYEAALAWVSGDENPDAEAGELDENADVGEVPKEGI